MERAKKKKKNDVGKHLTNIFVDVVDVCTNDPAKEGGVIFVGVACASHFHSNKRLPHTLGNRLQNLSQDDRKKTSG